MSNFKECLDCGSLKALNDFHKQKLGKLGRRSKCKVCIKTDNRTRYIEHKDSIQLVAKKWKDNNKERTSRTNKEWSDRNPDKRNNTTKQWKLLKPEMVAAGWARRRATILGATPTLTKEERYKIVSIYKECRRISIETGIKHHVDHIKPLSKGGLHHPDNLQILTETENLRKGAKYGN